MNQYSSLLEIATFTLLLLEACMSPPVIFFGQVSYLSIWLAYVSLQGDKAPVSVAFHVIRTRKPPHLGKVVKY